jgi:hydrocephalus-inducing protein
MPVLLNVMAESIGPIVKVDKADIDYGNVSVLRDYTERVSIKNESKIEAEYTAFTKLKESVWKVVQRHGILKPDETKVIEVVCNADEVQKFQDTLHVIINNGEDKEVNLRAKGIGHTLSCKALEDQGGVDFGTEYTHKNVPKQFFLENRGRKTMQISWVRQTKTDRKKKNPKEEAALAKTNQSGGLGASEKEEEVQFVYTVVPEKVTLNPKMGIMIEFRANSFKTGKISEIWQCQVMTGAERKPKPVWTLNVFGNFITPTLMFNGMEK